jgi:hypothetical protein
VLVQPVGSSVLTGVGLVSEVCCWAIPGGVHSNRIRVTVNAVGTRARRVSPRATSGGVYLHPAKPRSRTTPSTSTGVSSSHQSITPDPPPMRAPVR